MNFLRLNSYNTLDFLCDHTPSIGPSAVRYTMRFEQFVQASNDAEVDSEAAHRSPVKSGCQLLQQTSTFPRAVIQRRYSGL
jgi:hypothetical protein